jgi:hypothetical protein
VASGNPLLPGLNAKVSIKSTNKLTLFFQLFVRTICCKTISLDVQPNDTIAAVKSKILSTDGSAAQQQRLAFAGKQLQDARSLRDCGIDRDCTLHLSGLLESSKRSCNGCFNSTSRSDAASIIRRDGFRSSSGGLTGGGIYFAESISDASRAPRHATSSHPTPAPVPQHQTKPCIAPTQLQSKSKAQRHPERPAQLRGKVSKSEMRRRVVMRVQQPRGNYIAQTGPGYGGRWT